MKQLPGKRRPALLLSSCNRSAGGSGWTAGRCSQQPPAAKHLSTLPSLLPSAPLISNAARRSGEFWIQCDECDRWFDGKCVGMTAKLAEEQPQWKCPLCP